MRRDVVTAIHQKQDSDRRNLLTFALPVLLASGKDLVNVIRAQSLLNDNCALVLLSLVPGLWSLRGESICLPLHSRDSLDHTEPWYARAF